MTERIVRPVRAWAVFESYSAYIEDDFDGGKGRPFWIWWYPRNGDGGADECGISGVQEGIKISDEFVGSDRLLSLRVLYENKAELHLSYSDPANYVSDFVFDIAAKAGDPLVPRWYWYLVAEDDENAGGDFTEDSDAAAVERAMIAAAAWFTQRQEQVK